MRFHWVVGALLRVEDISLDVSEKEFAGWLPCGPFNKTKPGPNTLTTIDTADVRVLRVTVTEDPAAVAAVVPTPSPPLPRGVGLPLRSVRSIRKEILRRPTFLAHFDSVILDHRSLGCVVGAKTAPFRFPIVLMI